MKNLKEKLINEAKKTDFEKIEDLGASWIKEWGSEYCGNILSSVIKGIQKGIKENPYTNDKNAYPANNTFQKRCEDCIKKILNEINEDIY
jgi:hypothetical protein